MINLNVAMIYCPSPGKKPQTLITTLRPKLIQGAELTCGNPAFASSSPATSITSSSSAGGRGGSWEPRTWFSAG